MIPLMVSNIIRVKNLPVFEVAGMLIRFDHAARFMISANHSIMRAAVELGVADCVADCIRPAIPQATEWQDIGNQIDATFIFAGADFVSVHGDKQQLFAVIWQL